MGHTRTARPWGRLAALAAAAGALWLIAHPGTLPDPASLLDRLPDGGEVAQTLLELRLPSPGKSGGLDAVVLDRLPQVQQETSPEENAPELEEPSLSPAEQAEETPAAGRDGPEAVTGVLEAPEADIPDDGMEKPVPPEEIPDIDLDPAKLKLTNSTDGIDLELGDYLSQELPLKVCAQGPQILIMHTHATEAYTMADGDNYTPSDTARTTDENYNMIRVGEEMKAVFEQMGLTVIHDTTLYDYPGYNGSYARSMKGIERYLEEYPTISVVLDVHRDALIGSDGTVYKVTDTVDGQTVAQVMLVVGTNDGGLEHPGWEKNFTLAAYIQARMLMIDEDFPRPVNLRSQRFNQHMTAGSLLVEVGTSGNTLQEALAGARLFARAAGEVYLKCIEEP